MKRQFFLVIGAIALMLNACSQLATTDQLANDWQASAPTRDFNASGKISIKYNEKGNHASFDWSRQNGVETIDINTPLGNTVGQLCQDQQGVIAINSKGKLFQAQSAQQLSQTLIGYEIPLQYLSTWIEGRYTTDLPHQILSDGSLQQGDWRIVRKINAEQHPTALHIQGSQLNIKIFINDINYQSENPPPQSCEARQNP